MRIDSSALPTTFRTIGGNTARGNNVESADQEFKQILEKAVASKEDKQLKEAAKQFETLFLYQMYSKMRDSIDKGGLFEGGLADDIFQGMLDQEVSAKASETGSLGLADLIYKQLKMK